MNNNKVEKGEVECIVWGKSKLLMLRFVVTGWDRILTLGKW